MGLSAEPQLSSDYFVSFASEPDSKVETLSLRNRIPKSKRFRLGISDSKVETLSLKNRIPKSKRFRLGISDSKVETVSLKNRIPKSKRFRLRISDSKVETVSLKNLGFQSRRTGGAETAEPLKPLCAQLLRHLCAPNWCKRTAYREKSATRNVCSETCKRTNVASSTSTH